MDQYTFRLMLIGPYREMDVGFRDLAAAENCELRIVDATWQAAARVVRDITPESCDVILSRSITADVIRRNTDIPVVSVNFTAVDLLHALLPYRNTVRHAAFFRYKTPLRGLEDVEAALGMRITQSVFLSKSRMHEQLRQISPTEVDLVVGGLFAPELAGPLGFKTLQITNGKDAVAQAMRESLGIARVRLMEQQHRTRMRAVLDAVDEGIVTCDEIGRITLMNPAAEQLLGREEAAARNAFVESLLPALRVTNGHSGGQANGQANGQAGRKTHDTLTAKAEYGRVLDVDGATLVVNSVPLTAQGRRFGTVHTFSDASRIRTKDAQIRNRLIPRAFTARYSFDCMQADSPQMREICRLGRLYASTDANLVIYGESGTGKEVLAQSIHNAGARAGKPFVAVNCAAIPEGLLESELFGYAEGAFTGAAGKGKAGMLELAHAGTFFLDEIGDLPLALQGRLLRALQEKEIMRVGGTGLISLDVRFICATNHDLAELVRQKCFRADLFYRLNVLGLTLPPLRERPEDIMGFAVPHLLRRLRLPPEATVLASALAPALTRHDWPGNFRELLNVLERLAVVADHEQTVADWKSLLRTVWNPEYNTPAYPPANATSCTAFGIASNTSAITPGPAGHTGHTDHTTPTAHIHHTQYTAPEVSLRDYLREAEKSRIKAVVNTTGGDMGKAATLLGISRMTLWRKLHAADNAEPTK